LSEEMFIVTMVFSIPISEFIGVIPVVGASSPKDVEIENIDNKRTVEKIPLLQ